MTDEAPPAPADPKPARRKRSWAQGLALGFAIAGLIFAAFGLVARYGVLLPQARLLIEARTDGLKVGRFGKLKIEGLSGDIWRNFGIRRLTISDEKGVWLDARGLTLKWSYMQLLSRRLQIDEVTARQVLVARRPTLSAPGGVSKGMPVSIIIDKAQARVDLAPAFSVVRGAYDARISGLELGRTGGQEGAVALRSRTRPGDRLDAKFLMGGPRKALQLDVVATEASGGALAGAVGLDPGKIFDLRAKATGTTSQGRFDMRLLSGQAIPAQATGAWTPEGGRGQGRVTLTASTLTRDWAKRVGPYAAFQVSGRKLRKGLYALDAQARAENLSVALVGDGNIGERRTGPTGVDLSLATPDIKRFVSWVSGGVALRGRFKGEAADWDFEGRGDLTRIGTAGYVLQRVTGPVQLGFRKGQLDVSGEVAGSGGGGEGILLAALGAAPKATFEVSRLKDGRLSFRSFTARGDGLVADGKGGQGLFGDLGFEGKATLSNLARANPNAKGELSGTWRARQSGPFKPWTFDIDARANGFATGVAELDRLLGSDPRLTMDASLETNNDFKVASAKVTGGAASLAAAGVREAAGALKFKVDWQASGPFRVGPVEVTGNAAGTGGLTGTFEAPRLDLLADIDQIDLPRLPLRNAKLTLSFLRQANGSNGVITLVAASDHGEARARSDFAFAGDGADLTNLDVDAGGVKAKGRLALRRGSPSSADLTLAIGPGAILERGEMAGTLRIVDQAPAAHAAVDLTARNAVMKGSPVAIRNGRFTGDGPLAAMPYRAEATGVMRTQTWRLDGSGVLDASGPDYRVTFDGAGGFGKASLRTVESAVVSFGGPTTGARLRLAADQGRVDVDARFDQAGSDVQARLTNVALGLVNEDLTGQMDGRLTLQGRGASLAGQLTAQLEGARARGAAADLGLSGTLNAQLQGDTLRLVANATNAQGLKSNADVTFPAEASAAPFRIAINRQRPMRGSFSAEGEVKPLWDLLVGGDRTLSGHVTTSGTIAGSLGDPRLVGVAAMDRGRFEDTASGLALNDVVVRAALADNLVNVSQFTATDGHGGSVTGDGRFSLLRGGASSFEMDLKGFRLIDNELGDAQASGKATMRRSADGKVTLEGDLTIDRADIAANPPVPSGVVPMEVVERNKPQDEIALLPTGKPPGPTITLNVSLKAPRRVFVRGRGLDVELSLDAQVTGTTDRPQLSGTARVIRGDYDFGGKRFEFDDRGVIYLATQPDRIRIDLTATREDPSLTAVVRIRGTAAKPEIVLTSSPVLPNDEVLSQVLFGRSASQLSPLEAAQLAAALSALAGGGGFDVIGGLRTLAGLDRLAFAGGDEAGVSVAGGKYLTEDVYLEIAGGGRDGSRATVEWRVRRALSVVSSFTSQGDARLSVRWRRDY